MDVLTMTEQKEHDVPQLNARPPKTLTALATQVEAHDKQGRQFFMN